MARFKVFEDTTLQFNKEILANPGSVERTDPPATNYSWIVRCSTRTATRSPRCSCGAPTSKYSLAMTL